MDFTLSISKEYLMGLGLAVLIVVVARFLRVSRLLQEVITEDSSPDVPEGISAGQWEKIVFKPVSRGGDGFFETLLFVITMLTGTYLLIGVWLIFKALVWWMVWRHVIQVPPHLGDVEEAKDLAARSQWGAWIARLLLTGTAVNFVLATAACLGGFGFSHLFRRTVG
jgi:hypothetical protein